MNEWKKTYTTPEGVKTISFGRSWFGRGDADITVRLQGDDVDALKDASLDIQDQLRSFEGVTSTKDDLPFGTEQWRFNLTPEAKAMGLSLPVLAGRLQTLLDGKKVAFVQENGRELDIRISLPESQSGSLAMLEALPISLGNGEWAPVSSLLEVEIRRGVDSLVREDGELAINVSAVVDDKIANVGEIQGAVEKNILPLINENYNVEASLKGDREFEKEVLSQLLVGVVIAFALIFGILAWVFESWVWPFAVLAAIPFGLTGAIFGHWVLDLQISLLSLFGLFGLSGIVVNDSIVLVSFYQRLRKEGMAINEAIIEAACQRLRPVLLTTITTIAGLTPLLFESSFDAQFLIPMAAVIVFGLAFGTVLILLLVPGVLLSIENARVWLESAFSKRPSFDVNAP